MSKQRRRFESAEKVKIIRGHLVDKRPLSEVCDQYGIAPTQFYQWQKQFFEQGTSAFEPKKASKDHAGTGRRCGQYTGVEDLAEVSVFVEAESVCV